jgi:hypothetical protein
MQTKLTLSVDKSVIIKAKKYALLRKKSLSQIIENYLKSLYYKDNDTGLDLDVIPPVTKSLAGLLKGKKEIDFRSSITDYLENKYK